MKENQHFCFKHSELITFRRCFVCHKSLCRECQNIKSHHVFCGNLCWLKYQTNFFVKKINVFINKSKILLSLWTLVVIFIVLLFNFGLTLRDIQNKLEQIRKPANIYNKGEKVKTIPMEMKIISPSTTESMVYHNSITIVGRADDNSVVMLLDGQRLLQAIQPDNGKFVFKNVKLPRRESEFFVQMVSPEGEKLFLETLKFHYNSPTVNYLSGSLDRGNLEKTSVALTFDGGYINNISNEILDYLKDLSVNATFFLTGNYVKSFPETVIRIVAEGHEVGNHTMNHPHLTTYAENKQHLTVPGVNCDFLFDELQSMGQTFFELTGQKTSLIWRAPFGEQNLDIRSWAAELGYRHIGWTVGQGNGENMDTMDWISDPAEPGYLTSTQIQDKILNFASYSDHGAAGAIILMHLGSERSGDFPHHRLPVIVSNLREKGYRFVKISEMLSETFN